MKKAVVALVLILASLALAACGGGGSTTSATAGEAGGAAAESEAKSEEGGKAEAEGGSAGTGSAIAIEANPEGQLMFEQKEVTAKPGKDTIDFTNQSSVPHNVTVENSAGEKIGETETLAEGSASATVNLKPGTYTFFCSVPGHREAGMEGKIVVK